jgi:hypothetical protein
MDENLWIVCMTNGWLACTFLPQHQGYMLSKCTLRKKLILKTKIVKM